VARSHYDQLTDAGKARRLKALVPEILLAYRIAPTTIRQCAIHTNIIFRVGTATGEQYALRIQRPGLHRPEETDLEMWWLQRLAADGLPVAAPVATADGRLVVNSPTTADVPVAHRCELFAWLPGSEPDEEQPEFFELLGALAARLHRQATGLDIPSHLPRRRWDAVMPYEESILFEPRFAEHITPARSATLKAGITRLDDALAATYDGTTEPILLHGDLHNGNVRIRRGQLSVFDFEDLIVGHPIHDIAVALYGSFYNADDYPTFLSAMRRGYESVSPWPLLHDDDLIPLFAARALGMINFCLFNGGDFLDYVPTLTARVGAFLDR
jgi:Ser/Thr protein kinase RdoA (MazF antagonist)